MAVNFPTSIDSFTTRNSGDTISEDHMNDVQDAIEALEAKVGADSSAVDTSLDYKVNNFFVENTTTIWFYQNTAPTGWTYQSGITDQVIAVKGGSDAYNVNGGTEENGTWTISGLASANESTHTHTGPSHTHTMGTHSHTGPSHTHTMGTHNHTVDIYASDRTGTILTHGSESNSFLTYAGGGNAWYNQQSVSSIGSGVRETSSDTDPGDTNADGDSATSADDPGDTNAGGTGATGAGDAHNHTVSHTPGWRPDAAVGIIAQFTGA